MVEIHNSMGELSQPPLSSYGMRGDLSMNHSICMSIAYCKDLVFMHNDLYDEYLNSFTIHVQAIVPSGRILPHKLHGKLWAINNFDHGHSLGGYREMISHLGCAPKAPNITHLLIGCEETMVEIKWWGYHLSCHYMR